MAPNNSRIIELLKSRNFALLWFGQSISRVGNFVYDAAIGLTVYMLTGSSVDVGIVLATFTIAQLISLLVGGPLVDRLVRKNIILATDCVATCVTAGLAISLAEGHINLLSLCGISACLGVLSAFHLPALRAILPEMVDEEHLHGANAFMGVTNSITRIVGPGLGGFLIATLGPVVTFVVDTLTFVVAVLTMLFTQVRIKKDTRNAPQRASMVSEAIDGIKQVLTENRLRDLMLIGALVNVLVLGPVAVLLPVIVSQEHLLIAVVGLVPAAQGIGALLSNLAALRYSKRFTSMSAIVLFSGIFGVSALLLGLSTYLAIWLLAGLLIGLGTVSNTLKQTLLQSQVPREYLGRIFSLDMVSSFALLPVSYAIAGTLSGIIGPRYVLVWAGIVELIVCLLLLVQYRLAFREATEVVSQKR